MKSRNTYIENLIKQGENQQLDFKFEISDSKKIARTLSAFSNTDGGTLLIGVKDNGAIAGISSIEEFHMLEAAAQLYSKPIVNFQAKEWVINGKTILEIQIPKDPYIPYKAPDNEGHYKAYVRVGDQNFQADPVLLQVWKWKKKNYSVRLQYNEVIQILFHYLRDHSSISLAQYCELARIRKNVARNILAKLIILGQIKIKLGELESYYSIPPKDE